MRKRTAFFILALVLAFSAAVPASAALIMPASSPVAWYADAAEKYGYQDIFGDVFEPQRPVTRMQFARLLTKAFDISPENGNSASRRADADVLMSLAAAGIIPGVDGFNPDGALDRATMVHWVIKTLDYLTGGQYAMIMIMPEPFADDALIPDAYRGSVVKAVILKLVNGRGNNIFAPLDSATCAEAVVIVARLKDLAATLIPDVTVRANLTKQDDTITMSLALKNNTGEPVVIHQPSAQRYDFKLFDEGGKLLYIWSLGRMFSLVLSTTEIAPGQTVLFTETVSAEELGEAYGNVAYMIAYITGTSEGFAIEEDGYSAYLG